MTFERSLWQQFKSPRYWVAVIALSVAILLFAWLMFTSGLDEFFSIMNRIKGAK